MVLIGGHISDCRLLLHSRSNELCWKEKNVSSFSYLLFSSPANLYTQHLPYTNFSKRVMRTALLLKIKRTHDEVGEQGSLLLEAIYMKQLLGKAMLLIAYMSKRKGRSQRVP